MRLSRGRSSTLHPTFVLRPDLDVLYFVCSAVFPKRGAHATGRFYQTSRWCGSSALATRAQQTDIEYCGGWLCPPENAANIEEEAATATYSIGHLSRREILRMSAILGVTSVVSTKFAFAQAALQG